MFRRWLYGRDKDTFLQRLTVLDSGGGGGGMEEGRKGRKEGGGRKGEKLFLSDIVISLLTEETPINLGQQPLEFYFSNAILILELKPLSPGTARKGHFNRPRPPPEHSWEPFSFHNHESPRPCPPRRRHSSMPEPSSPLLRHSLKKFPYGMLTFRENEGIRPKGLFLFRFCRSLSGAFRVGCNQSFFSVEGGGQARA